MNPDPRNSSCSNYLNFRSIEQNSLDSPVWYLDMFGFTSNVRFWDRKGACLKAFLDLSFVNWSRLESAGRFTLRLTVTLLDTEGVAPDRLLGEKLYKYDGDRKAIDEWSRALLTVKLKPKEMKELGLPVDFHTLAIRYDAAIVY
ncbi:unnamed protein product [Lymnaea stagnalis]|uniref:MATH domain-containing protein n=1 Tax=Lymnaea stagnalis TaxID=6523 RepID=A0AAV2I7W1_LYMST